MCEIRRPQGGVHDDFNWGVLHGRSSDAGNLLAEKASSVATLGAVERHVAHDELKRAVRSWYVGATREIGIRSTEVAWGYLVSSDRIDMGRAVLTMDSPSLVVQAVGEAVDFFGNDAFDVWVDDRVRARLLTPALAAAGFETVQDTVVLALVGRVRAEVAPPEGLTVDDVADLDGLNDWVRVKLQGFADSEDPPEPDQLRQDASVRTAEWPVCRYQLGRLRDEPVAILGHYTGMDQMVFLLATRVPFRRRGIGQTMLANWSEHVDGEQPRSRLINCNDGGAAARLYQRIGFTDEVYWHRQYVRTAPNG